MQKIKVLHVLYSFGIGGMEKGIAMLINHASPEIEHQILCLTQTGASRQLIPAEIPIHEMHKPPGNSIGFIWQLVKQIRQIRPDIVHTRNWGGMDAIIAARLAGCSAIVHGEHGWGMDDPDGCNRKRMLARRWLSPLVSEFTAVSRQIEHWLTEDIKVFRPVTQIYNGVQFTAADNGRDKSWLRRELNLSESASLIGTVGRLDPIKDQAGLIKAFGLLARDVANCHLLIVGDGPERSALEALAGENVHLLGMRSDVPDILRALDLFVLPSLNEGISNTILEAMAAGLPVVATKVGGTPELIQHEINGLLVEPRDYASLKKAMHCYLDCAELRQRHGTENRKIINARFSVDSMVTGYENVWQRATQSKPHA